MRPTRDEVRRQLSEFGKPQKDPRAWARRIMVRKESGERVPDIAVQFAREALGWREREPGED